MNLELSLPPGIEFSAHAKTTHMTDKNKPHEPLHEESHEQQHQENDLSKVKTERGKDATERDSGSMDEGSLINNREGRQPGRDLHTKRSVTGSDTDGQAT